MTMRERLFRDIFTLSYDNRTMISRPSHDACDYRTTDATLVCATVGNRVFINKIYHAIPRADPGKDRNLFWVKVKPSSLICNRELTVKPESRARSGWESSAQPELRAESMSQSMKVKVKYVQGYLYFVIFGIYRWCQAAIQLPMPTPRGGSREFSWWGGLWRAREHKPIWGSGGLPPLGSRGKCFVILSLNF